MRNRDFEKRREEENMTPAGTHRETTTGTHARRIAPAHSRTANRGGRNSNIELLRIFAMLCVAFNHFPWPTQGIVNPEGFSQHLPTSLALSLISNLGGLGDCLFFFISIWYICEETANYKRQCKRVWILERELLFWSILLLVGNLLSQGLGFQDSYSKKELFVYLIHGLFPALSTHWWFPTHYMLFLLIVPALSTGLRSVGKHLHGILAIILFAFNGLIPFEIMDKLPNGNFHSTMNYSVWLFIYQFVLITYIKWYRQNWLKSKSLMTAFMWIGGLANVISQLAGTILLSIVSNEYVNPWYLWMNNPACFPSMMFALGLLAIAQQKQPWHNVPVNTLASATLTVYLLFTDPFTYSIIAAFTQLVPQHGATLLLVGVIVCLATFALCILLGIIRQALFAVTIDLHRGRWFELLWNKASAWTHIA